MKTLTIYKRSILEKTGFKKYPYKEVEQVSIFYNGKEISNHYVDVNNPLLKIKFNKVLDTRSKKEVENYISKLSRTNVSKWIKQQLNAILNEVN